MPKKAAIYKYWAETLCHDFGKFWLDVDYETNKSKILNTCFACGSEIGVQRSHIKPNWQGGTEDISNLHLLCPMCHIESESYTGELYNEWLHFKTPINSGSLLMINNRISLMKSLVEDNKSHLLPEYIKKAFSAHNLIE